MLTQTSDLWRPAGSGEDEAAEALEAHLFSGSLEAFERRIGSVGRLGRLWRLIKENYSAQGFHLGEAARGSGMSINTLNRLLRLHSNLTFHQLLNRYRMFKAIEKMAQKDASILEIALECGFGSQSSFERNSKKFLGLQPKELRRLVVDRTRGDRYPIVER